MNRGQHLLQSVKTFAIWSSLTVVSIFAILILLGAILAVRGDNIWTDPATGCRYKGGAESYTPLLLPNGLPDCRPTEVKP